MTDKISIHASGDTAQLTFPRSIAHDLRVALRPVQAGETVSLSTQRIRDAFDKALARIDDKRS